MISVYGEKVAHLPDLDALYERIGWQIDHLMSIDTLGRGLVPQLYEAAVDLVGGPLTMTAARRLRKVVGPGDVVGIITGFPSRSFLGRGITETDGPVGAVYLARVLEQVLDAVPVIVIDGPLKRYCVSSGIAAGLLIGDVDTAILAKRGDVKASALGFLDCPVDDDTAREVAQSFFNDAQPKAMLAVEMPSLGADGYSHTASGRRITHEHLAKADHFFRLAGEHGILRVGIGDGGNEMGLARLGDTLARISAVGKTIAATTDSDVPVIGASSNWAAYAIGVCVEALAGTTYVNASIDLPAVIRRCAEEGAIDGVSSRPEARVDGTPIELNTGVVALMLWVVEQALAQANKGWLKS